MEDYWVLTITTDHGKDMHNAVAAILNYDIPYVEVKKVEDYGGHKYVIETPNLDRNPMEARNDFEGFVSEFCSMISGGFSVKIAEYYSSPIKRGPVAVRFYSYEQEEN